MRPVSNRQKTHRCAETENVMWVCTGRGESRCFDRYWRAVNVPGEWKGEARPNPAQLLHWGCEHHANIEAQSWVAAHWLHSPFLPLFSCFVLPLSTLWPTMHHLYIHALWTTNKPRHLCVNTWALSNYTSAHSHNELFPATAYTNDWQLISVCFHKIFSHYVDEYWKKVDLPKQYDTCPFPIISLTFLEHLGVAVTLIMTDLNNLFITLHNHFIYSSTVSPLEGSQPNDWFTTVINWF